MNQLADEINKLHHGFEELDANPTTFRTVINFELNLLSLLLYFWGEVIPPLLERIDDKITWGARNCQRLGVLVCYPHQQFHREYTFHQFRNHDHSLGGLL